jgi:hypothetical protein
LHISPDSDVDKWVWFPLSSLASLLARGDNILCQVDLQISLSARSQT